MHLNQPEFTTLNWLALLMNNRVAQLNTPIMRRSRDWLLDNCLLDIDGADVIVGYRADDAYFSFVRAFVSNTISLEQLSYAMRLGRLGEQYVIKSPRAFDALEFLDAEPVHAEEWFARKKARADEAYGAYVRNLEREDRGGIYIRDLVEGRVLLDDARVQ